MTVAERVAYLKGLYEGLEIDGKKKEGKLLKGILDVLESMAECVSDLECQGAELEEDLDGVYEELSALQEDFIEHDSDLEIDAQDDEDLYQVICPTCGETIYINEETLQEGGIQCHACGESLEFDLSALDESWEDFHFDFEEEPSETDVIAEEDTSEE